jgi:hypothetical protein
LWFWAFLLAIAILLLLLTWAEVIHLSWPWLLVLWLLLLAPPLYSALTHYLGDEPETLELVPALKPALKPEKADQNQKIEQRPGSLWEDLFGLIAKVGERLPASSEVDSLQRVAAELHNGMRELGKWADERARAAEELAQEVKELRTRADEAKNTANRLRQERDTQTQRLRAARRLLTDGEVRWPARPAGAAGAAGAAVGNGREEMGQRYRHYLQGTFRGLCQALHDRYKSLEKDGKKTLHIHLFQRWLAELLLCKGSQHLAERLLERRQGEQKADSVSVTVTDLGELRDEVVRSVRDVLPRYTHPVDVNDLFTEDLDGQLRAATLEGLEIVWDILAGPPPGRLLFPDEEVSLDEARHEPLPQCPAGKTARIRFTTFPGYIVLVPQVLVKATVFTDDQNTAPGLQGARPFLDKSSGPAEDDKVTR